MFPPKKILFPVDFSERCTDAARMAETFAGHFEAELTLLYVLEPFTYNDVPVDTAALTENQLRSYLAKELQQINTKRVLLHGDPATQIAGFAQSENFDLIMLPTHGYGAFRRMVLGSVTARVLHEAQCPVWTGVHMEQVPELENIAFRKIVCAIDFGPQSCPTVRYASQFASEFEAELQIAHVIPDLEHAFVAPAGHEGVAHAIEKIGEIQKCVGSQHKPVVLEGEVPHSVCGFAGRERADVLIIGRSVHTGVMNRLRANAYSIIRQSPCPVISI